MSDAASVEILVGDVFDRLAGLPDDSVDVVVTSPPYWGLRDYGVDGQIGLEATPDAYVAVMVAVFREVRRVLRDDGTLWLNLGDSYAGSWGAQSREPAGSMSRTPGLKPKDLIGIPWRVAFGLQADGWYLRSAIVWHKPNPMPESVTDRPTSAYEMVFLLSKSERYFYDAEAIKEDRTSDEDANGFRGGAYVGGEIDNQMMGKRTERGNIRRDKQRGHSRRHAGFNDRWDAMTKAEQQSMRRNKRNVWTIATRPFADAHFATFPPDLVEPCILAGCSEGGLVLDPFGGAGTTGLVAQRLGRRAILIELNPDYAALARARIDEDRMGPVTRAISRATRKESVGHGPLFDGEAT